jgi:hypothetical protein
LESVFLGLQQTFTSDLANVIVFNPEGCHRGGFVKFGSRSLLQITIGVSKLP